MEAPGTDTTRAGGPESRRRLARALAGLVDRVDAKEGYGHRHAHRVAMLADSVASELGFEGPDAASVRLAAYVHDVGKIAVPREVLRKPGPLTSDEWGLVRRHSAEGERVLGPLLDVARVVPARRTSEVLTVVRSHHERWDGRGYPDGLSGERIPVGARIVAVCDAFEAMTESRSYRAPLRPEQALAELAEHAGSQFDPSCVEALLGVVADELGVDRRLPLPPVARAA